MAERVPGSRGEMPMVDLPKGTGSPKDVGVRHEPRAACEPLLTRRRRVFQVNGQDSYVVLLGVFSFLVQEEAWEKTVLGRKQKRWFLMYDV